MAKQREGSASLLSKWKHHGSHLVEIKRTAKGMGRTAGFLVGCSDALVLLRRLEWDTFRLNGYTVVRYDDIGAYRFFDKADYWQFRAIRRFRLVAARPHKVSIGSWPDLIRSVARKYPLITVHRERLDPETCAIGTLATISPTTFTIEDLDSTGAWTGLRRLKFSDVTRIDFGGGYENALAATAPKRPSR